MQFLELIAKDRSELSKVIFDEFKKNKTDLTREDLNNLVRGHQVYFQNKPVGFLPFQIHKKGKIQIYLNNEVSFKLTKKDILFEDKWLIVINKPSGIPSQASLKFLQDHAYGATMVYLRNKKFQTSPYLALSHRLDMDTSGVLLMVKKTSANKGIADLFANREIKKTYLALTSSEKKPQEKFSVKNYLERAGKDFRFQSSKDINPEKSKKAKYAETKFELLKSLDSKHLFKVSPKTGRSHQIRVHLSEAGFPILGDQFYNENKERSHKLHLHAASLEFKHPMTKEIITVSSKTPEHWLIKVDLSSNPF